ncbi:BapA/Bap/LapF family prefix-like domain-containing protein [Tropicimonas sp. TH_r6]|uniref:BapA/Bap/LapF family prefix-like domain-containing protein n=1 Tax=Tropicimonas sp. TH_r6 TaxID=3082085 RepID=UPI003988062A
MQACRPRQRWRWRGETENAANSAISVDQRADVSLNLSPVDVASYTRDRSDLKLQLTNGDTITLQDYSTRSATCFSARTGRSRWSISALLSGTSVSPSMASCARVRNGVSMTS